MPLPLSYCRYAWRLTQNALNMARVSSLEPVIHDIHVEKNYRISTIWQQKQNETTASSLETCKHAVRVRDKRVAILNRFKTGSNLVLIVFIYFITCKPVISYIIHSTCMWYGWTEIFRIYWKMNEGNLYYFILLTIGPILSNISLATSGRGLMGCWLFFLLGSHPLPFMENKPVRDDFKNRYKLKQRLRCLLVSSGNKTTSAWANFTWNVKCEADHAHVFCVTQTFL